jgi:hypothetical protein
MQGKNKLLLFLTIVVLAGIVIFKSPWRNYVTGKNTLKALSGAPCDNQSVDCESESTSVDREIANDNATALSGIRLISVRPIGDLFRYGEVCYINNKSRYICTKWRTNFGEPEGDAPEILPADFKGENEELFTQERYPDGSRRAVGSKGSVFSFSNFNTAIAHFDSRFQNARHAMSSRVQKNCVLFLDNSISCSTKYIDLSKIANSENLEWLETNNPSNRAQDSWVTLTSSFEKIATAPAQNGQEYFSSAICAVTRSGKIDCFGDRLHPNSCEDPSGCDTFSTTEIERKTDVNSCVGEKCGELRVTDILYAKSQNNLMYVNIRNRIRQVGSPKDEGTADITHNGLVVRNDPTDNSFIVTSLYSEPNLMNFHLTNASGQVLDLLFSNTRQPVMCYTHSGGNIHCTWQEGSQGRSIEFPPECGERLNDQSTDCAAPQNAAIPDQGSDLSQISYRENSSDQPSTARPAKGAATEIVPQPPTPELIGQKREKSDTEDLGNASNESSDNQLLGIKVARSQAQMTYQGNWSKGTSWGPTCLANRDFRALVLPKAAVTENSPCNFLADPSQGNMKFVADCVPAEQLAGRQCTEGDTDNYACRQITSWVCE